MVIKLGYHNDPPPIENNRSHVEEKNRARKSYHNNSNENKETRSGSKVAHNHASSRTKHTDGSPNKQQRKLKRESNHTEGGLEEGKGKRQDVDGGTLHLQVTIEEHQDRHTGVVSEATQTHSCGTLKITPERE